MSKIQEIARGVAIWHLVGARENGSPPEREASDAIDAIYDNNAGFEIEHLLRDRGIGTGSASVAEVRRRAANILKGSVKIPAKIIDRIAEAVAARVITAETANNGDVTSAEWRLDGTPLLELIRLEDLEEGDGWNDEWDDTFLSSRHVTKHIKGRAGKIIAARFSAVPVLSSLRSAAAPPLAAWVDTNTDEVIGVIAGQSAGSALP